jgi:hypothetical protein
MKEAQNTADPQGTSTLDNPGHSQFSRRSSTPEPAIEVRQNLETLANAVHCFSLALPDRLHYRGQYLAFGAPVPRQAECRISATAA